MKVIKKDGTLEDYNEQKIVNAVHKSAARAMVELTESQYADIVGCAIHYFYVVHRNISFISNSYCLHLVAASSMGSPAL